MLRGGPSADGGPKRILWISYLRPEGFSLASHSLPGVTIEEVTSEESAVAWAHANSRTRVYAVVIVVGYLPDLGYDPAQILQTVKAACRTIRCVISVREKGPLFRLSHYAFTAEFGEICGSGTFALEADSATTFPPGEPVHGKPEGDDKQAAGAGLVPNWDQIAGHAVALALGRARISPPPPSDEADQAMRLIRAMRESASSLRADVFKPIHKRIMIELSQPGASMHSQDIAGKLGCALKTVTNSYSEIAAIMSGWAEQDPGLGEHPAQWASDFCKQLGRDYQEWLVSYGIRSGLGHQSHGARRFVM